MKFFTACFGVLLPLWLAYLATGLWIIERWDSATGYYQHGWLLPLVGLGLLWQTGTDTAERRRVAASWCLAPAAAAIGLGVVLALSLQLQVYLVLGTLLPAALWLFTCGRRVQVDRRALWLLVPGLLVHVAGALLTIDSLSATSLVIVLPATFWLIAGPDAMRGRVPLLLLVMFAIPMPMYVEGRIGFVLKEFAVTGGAGLANLLGAGVTRNGSDLLVAGQERTLYVAEACGGLRSLLAMVTLGYCVAFFLGGRQWLRRGVLLLATVPFAVLANVVRIGLLCLMASWFGVDFAEGTGHTLANVLEWVAAVGALLLLDRLVSRFARGPAASSASAPEVPVATAERTAAGVTVVVALWLLTVPVLWLSFYRPAVSGGDRAAQLPTTVAGYNHVPRSTVAEQRFQNALPRYVELLGTDDFVWREYRDAVGSRVHVVALFHDTNWKSVHPPRICIEGSNMAIEVDDLVPASWLGEGVMLSRIVARSNVDNWQYLTLSVFGTGDWASGDYNDFFWHHLPGALLRQSQSGFLFRVETPVTPGESLEVAATRCERFLEGVLPAARGLLQ
ncbi:MAG: exosortase-associated EpsI family protein [bacterium]|nr:exosortase-associated EpsI family protein [bacterium]